MEGLSGLNRRRACSVEFLARPGNEGTWHSFAGRSARRGCDRKRVTANSIRAARFSRWSARLSGAGIVSVLLTATPSFVIVTSRSIRNCHGPANDLMDKAREEPVWSKMA